MRVLDEAAVPATVLRAPDHVEAAARARRERTPRRCVPPHLPVHGLTTGTLPVVMPAPPEDTPAPLAYGSRSRAWACTPSCATGLFRICRSVLVPSPSAASDATPAPWKWDSHAVHEQKLDVRLHATSTCVSRPGARRVQAHNAPKAHPASALAPGRPRSTTQRPPAHHAVPTTPTRQKRQGRGRIRRGRRHRRRDADQARHPNTCGPLTPHSLTRARTLPALRKALPWR